MTLFLAQRPEDFRVTEVPLCEPEGAGPHTYLWLEKSATTTEAVALALARALGVHSREIGYAGRKDRNAIAKQWFSVPCLEPERALALSLPEARVLRALRGREKLRTGQLKANRFTLRVRSSADPRLELLRARAERLRREGVPNRFGGQRFGGDGGNAARGRELLQGRRRRRGHRDDRFFLSAWQSLLFNRILAERPSVGALEAGDIAYDHGDGRHRTVLDPSAHAEEVAAFRLSPTGPMFGTRAPLASGVPGERELAVLRQEGFESPSALTPPRGVRLPGARRPLRVAPGPLHIDEVAPHEWSLRFELPPGSYATVLVEELFEDADVRVGPGGERRSGDTGGAAEVTSRSRTPARTS